jgi:hypothetical protein
MKRILIGLTLALFALSAWAIPSVGDVETAVKQGQYAKAETMMSEVVAERKDSAKARYLYAEILARNGRIAQAAEQARLAQQLDPAIRFTQPEKFNAFVQQLERQQAASPGAPATRLNDPGTVAKQPPVAPAPQRSSTDGGIPAWMWGAGLLAIGLVLWRMIGRRRATAPGMGYGPPGVGPQGHYPAQYPGHSPMASGYGPGPGPTRGGGLLGAGLAGAGGFAAGMMVDRMLHPDHGQVPPEQTSGLQPGIFDDESTQLADNDFAERPIDFGHGGDWDAGGDLGGDVASSGGDGDGW